ncbi:hypothetical protein B9Z55_028749 [Caenorhabditis nigoni]|uniref:Uncharacterized protein n=1 Tax=Caenorhabditis nigoni TaxID=1611254 RepID=A0A2G5SA72_9PELO|nr:hypothetical protein B9Z55_028749 [Caenorhabditis nigoni]
MGLPEESPTSSALPSAPPLNSEEASNGLSEEEQLRLREEEDRRLAEAERQRQEDLLLDDPMEDEDSSETRTLFAGTSPEELHSQRQLTATMEDVRGFYTAANNSVDGGNEMRRGESQATSGTIQPSSSFQMATMQMKYEQLKAEKEKLEAENRLLKAHTSANSLSRRDVGKVYDWTSILRARNNTRPEYTP